MSPTPAGQVRPLLGGTAEAAVRCVLDHLPDAIFGTGPALFLTDPQQPGRPPAGVPAGVAAVRTTSGSTSGEGRRVALDGAALRASAQATADHLAGPGHWVSCLPVHHVAGFQVLVRSVVAGSEPVVLDTSDGFRAADLAAAVARLDPGLPGYLSLVPTQLSRVLADDNAVRAVRTLAAVLVGGARTAPAVLRAAREAGLPVVTTYGMTETGGGCVYDGRPLPGVEVEVDEEDRIWLSGPVLARGYLGDEAATREAFRLREGRRWLRTADRGELTEGLLTVLGRLDDTIISGGLNIAPGAVESVVAELPGAGDVVVVGVPDEHWGSLVTAVVTGGDLDLSRVRTAVGRQLGRASAPRALVRLPELPLRGPGKIDRRAAAATAAARLAAAAPGTEQLS